MGGTLVYSYDQIGVAIARSDNASFRDNLIKDNRVENASPTAGFATQLPDEHVAAGPEADLPNAPTSDAACPCPAPSRPTTTTATANAATRH